MAYENLKSAIKQAIKQNGNQEITGNLLQSTLLNIVNALGADYKFLGFASPSTVPPTSEEGNLFYFAIKPGNYSNFKTNTGNLVITIENGVFFFTKNATDSYWNSNKVFEIAQTTGEAEDKVMSQKATSTAIEAVKNRAEAVEKAVIFDVSAYNDGAVFESLSVLLSASNLSTLIPTEVRCGGMTIRFIQSSDNKYVQYLLKTNSWSTNPDFWERYNDVITTDNQTNSDLDFSDEKGNVVMRVANGHIKTKNFDSKNIQPLSPQPVSKPKISYLAIGNSVNQDVVAYIPYLLKELYGDSVDFEIGIAFIGSYTIKDYVEQVITKQKKIEIYSYANNTDIWTNYNNTYYLEDILSLHQWNIISFQMYQTRTIVSAHIEDVTFAPQLLNYIKSKAIQDCVFGFVTPATYTDMRDKYIEWQQIVLTNCALDFFIDYGATKELMIKKGISSSLMTTDGYHSNEGFPCISLSLTAIHVLAKLINIKDKSSNLKNRMTAAKHSTLNIPNQNGSFTTTTENDWKIGIDSAINGFRVSNATLNISNNTLRQQTYNNN